MPEPHRHRPTLKQQNKPFKSKHASKGNLKDAAKGRTDRQSLKSTQSSSASSQKKVNRRNAAKQLQRNKRQELASAVRIFGGRDGAPRIVAIVPLCPDVRVDDVAKSIVRGYGGDTESCPKFGLWESRADRFKTSLQCLLLPYRQLYAALDACKVADYVVLVLSGETEVDSWGELALRCLQAQGLPEVVTVVQEMESVNPKSRSDTLKSLLSFIQYFVPTQTRVYDLDLASDATNAARALCEGKPKDVAWRKNRPWLLAEEAGWDTDSDTSGEADDTTKGTLRVIGVIRGGCLSANRLVHLPNFGDFQVEKITSATRAKGTSMDIVPEVLAEPSSDADSLVSRVDPNTMANEQTWPTDEEMRDVDEVSMSGDVPGATDSTKRKVRKVPKGTSAYQAAWILDDGAEDEEDDADDAEEDEEIEAGSEETEDEVEMHDAMSDKENMVPNGTDAGHSVGFDISSRKSEVHFDLDMDEEESQLKTWLQSRKREDREDLEFPDEKDTPRDIPARTRFQRYRGLKSFRTSPWDPFENLPLDYARIFQFEDYGRTKKKVTQAIEEEGVSEGRRVVVHLRNVPQAALVAYQQSFPFVLFALLEHEHKCSVLNFVVQRNTEYEGVVRSKDPLLLCAGPRRYSTNPIYSQYTRGGGKGTNNVHKFERFLRHGTATVATVYGPILFGKQPCLLLRETADPQEPYLVAMGTFSSPDTKRVIAKRILLTGVPFKVHKRTATIRFMFFNPDDVKYFAPIQLHTKHGRTGHISESLGTHGYFKAHFDGPITQMDTICLSLYKRVYPRWSELWKKPLRTIPDVDEPSADMEE